MTCRDCERFAVQMTPLGPFCLGCLEQRAEEEAENRGMTLDQFIRGYADWSGIDG